ncbi:CcmD family protein [Adlercreutzia agrestimuris]|uniref:CcmD family protein n=1 Tax=Adlercreutzia agrestimuris TaxID=2941324 RepID=UPI002040B0AA|nr:CcmD family protein [Adlercreutzia agrestimuris]
MNPVLAEIYSTILPSAPYIVAAYALMWLVLLIYVVMIVRNLKKTEAQMSILEEQVAELRVRSK